MPSFLNSLRILTFSSAAAFFVKVVINILFGARPWFLTRSVTFFTMVKVLPVPGPAMTAAG